MMKKWSLILLAVAVALSIVTQRSFTETSSHNPLLELNFYHNSCPRAEMIIRSTVDELFMNQSSVGPALVRLFFHDCFIMGCDASVLLLNSTSGGKSERDVPPNASLKGFDAIEEIKSRVELECPGVVSCSDILVLAARESVYLSGGPLYPSLTGRRDSIKSFPEMALRDIPAPEDDLSTILSKFSDRQFSPRETVSLLGAHSIGRVHCDFIKGRIFNFSGSDKPDPSIDPEFSNTMIERCSDQDAFIELSKDGAPEAGFGTHYYQSLVQDRSVLRSDQQLMKEEITASWVRAYASDQYVFTQDFSSAMAKLSRNGVLTGKAGQIRKTCSSIN